MYIPARAACVCSAFIVFELMTIILTMVENSTRMHCKQGIVILARGLLSELHREFKNENTALAVMCL